MRRERRPSGITGEVPERFFPVLTRLAQFQELRVSEEASGIESGRKTSAEVLHSTRNSAVLFRSMCLLRSQTARRSHNQSQA